MIALLWVLLGCGGAPDAAPVEVDPLARVAWTAPRPATHQILVTLPAEVEASPDGLTALGPRVPARIVQWLVAPGDAVARGDALAVVESPSLSGLTATVAGQRRARDAREAQLGAGMATIADLAEADAALAGNAAALASARALLQTRAGATVWTSPADGLISAVSCAQGIEVGPEDPCVTLVDPTRTTLLARVPERHLPHLDGLQGRWHGADGQTLDGLTLRAREPLAHAPSRTVAHRFALPEGVTLLPGTSGRLDLIVPIADTWAVPEAALTQLEGRPVVFVRDGEHARAVPVTSPGRDATPGHVLVQGALDASSAIAWRGVFLLKSLALLEEE